MSLTQGYFLWNAFHAFRYFDALGPTHGFFGQSDPRARSNETSGRTPWARAACSHASRRAGSVKTESHGVTRRAYLSFSTWNNGSVKVVGWLSEMPMAGSLPTDLTGFRGIEDVR